MTTETKQARDYLAIALDTDDLDHAVKLATEVQPYISVAKVGLELFDSAGKEAVQAMRDVGMDVFLDVKLHDIPTTVRKAATVLGAYGAKYLTLHSVGGEEMLQAGMQGLKDGAKKAGLPEPVALAVTVLTSEKLANVETLRERVSTAVDTGCPGVICAATDLTEVKGQAPSIFAVTPGIRPAGTPAHDQKRIATPAEAIRDGANLIVIGMAVTAAEDPKGSAQSIHEEVANRLASAS